MIINKQLSSLSGILPAKTKEPQQFLQEETWNNLPASFLRNHMTMDIIKFKPFYQQRKRLYFCIPLLLLLNIIRFTT